MYSKSQSRKAFTLVELLVIITIIGVLAILIIPAVQTAREAARRIQCSANLKQLGIALSNYESIHKMFPPSRLFTHGRSSGNRIAEHVFLLPYLEQTNIYNSINMLIAIQESAQFLSAENHTARGNSITLFLCPSENNQFCQNSYRFNRGIVDSQGYNGPFTIGEHPSSSSITDGLSNTALVSERIGGSFYEGQDFLKDIRSPRTISRPITDTQLITICDTSSIFNWNYTAGRFWFFTGFVFTGYNHNGSPNDKRGSCAGTASDDPDPGGLSPPRSYHYGGVNVLFGDGHVQWVSDSIAENTWLQLGTSKAGD